jgi:hypothetical protein
MIDAIKSVRGSASELERSSNRPIKGTTIAVESSMGTGFGSPWKVNTGLNEVFFILHHNGNSIL